MMKAASAAALLAAIFLSTSVLAQEGSYYEGADRNPPQEASAARDTSYGYTGSINNPALRNGWDTSPKTTNSGDYYGGSDRPN
ncbi:Hypothetical protein RG1141_CH20460 [Neorhizobium galegae bv. officinalis bv. officinalis str. HAMBI 1141]|uniref:Uncharacterized protein n=1 Tax=Neorhizobium galegae bv. officinalis bv. officinalis str. HAMBI 1141 TaxID=1028801 RepID=A0A068TAN7_NEOGA|nr:hypothetical protein [Neorhizobium galegae]CDN54385.1 Hypothetical protein RG1141_CH20460 [Neorhizobium galegae bv. officinalis bv. officinalis str. HAMBI 1141]